MWLLNADSSFKLNSLADGYRVTALEAKAYSKLFTLQLVCKFCIVLYTNAYKPIIWLNG